MRIRCEPLNRRSNLLESYEYCLVQLGSPAQCPKPSCECTADAINYRYLHSLWNEENVPVLALLPFDRTSLQRESMHGAAMTTVF